jgi:hypothetical protein
MLKLVPQDPVTCTPTEFDGLIDDLIASANAMRMGVPVQVGPVALFINPGESFEKVSTRGHTRLADVNREIEAFNERRHGERRKSQSDDAIPDRREGERRSSQQNVLRTT